jgi:hypothetical protein
MITFERATRSLPLSRTMKGIEQVETESLHEQQRVEQGRNGSRMIRKGRRSSRVYSTNYSVTGQHWSTAELDVFLTSTVYGFR